MRIKIIVIERKLTIMYCDLRVIIVVVCAQLPRAEYYRPVWMPTLPVENNCCAGRLRFLRMTRRDSRSTADCRHRNGAIFPFYLKKKKLKVS